MSDARDAVDEAKRLNRQLAAKRLVHLQDLQASGADETAIAAAKADYEQALAELRELDRLAGQADSLEARTIAAADSDPLIRSPEQVALDNVREHVANLDAQVKLGEELAPRAALAPVAAAEDPEEAARKQFEALRAKPKKTL